MYRRPIHALLILGLLTAGCSSDESTKSSSTSVSVASTAPTQTFASDHAESVKPTSTSAPAESAPTTDAVATTTPVSEPATTEPATTVPTVSPDDERSTATRALVEALASDELDGRDSGTAGSAAARELLISQLAEFAEPAFPGDAGEAGFVQEFDGGTNILAMIPGGELADQYVIVGGHYDHLAECRTADPSDSICNGAADNATGVAAAISVARTIAAAGVPRRSVLIALWDAEEDGLLGSAAYVAAPVVPLAQTVAYVNFDIQGVNLLPSLANTTVLVGAETGGPNLIDAATRALDDSSLDTVLLSLLFGQGRSDHANLVTAGVPSVFFTDANSGCYHTAQDDVDVVDFAKLGQQISTATALTTELIATDTPPAIDAAAPISTYADAVSMLAVTSRGQADLGLLGSEDEVAALVYIDQLRTIVDAGPDAFDGAAIGTVLGGAAALVQALSNVDCDGYLPS